MKLWRGDPIWLHGRAQRARQRYPVLNGRHTADVAVVGGGMTGALVAHAFAAAGVSVVVTEAALVGRGSTAASSALLLEEPDLGMGQLAERYGRAASTRVWELSRSAVRDLIAVIRKLDVACDLVRRDSVYYARTEDAVRRLREERDLRARAGFASEWLTPGGLRRLTGISGRGAIRTSGSAQFHPYKACVGIMQAARTAGAAIFERSAVVRIEQRAGGVRVHTAHGHVDAARVIVATGYATPDFKPLTGRFRMYRTYVLATSQLSERARREIGLGNVMVWDTERPYHYARWTPDDRLLLGGGDRPVRAGQRRDQQFRRATEQLRSDFEGLLPALADVTVESAWEGLFAMTPDSLPYIGPHRRYPGHLFALGYGGNGMTFAALAARILLENWQRVRSADHRLFGFDRTR